METSKLWILLGKKLSGEASPAELSELEQLLREDSFAHYPIETLEQYWHQNPQGPPPVSNSQIEKKWKKFQLRLDDVEPDDLKPGEELREEELSIPSRSNRSKAFWWMAAASVLFAVLSFFFFYNSRSVSTIARVNEISAPERGISKIKLPDGTRVWLNSGSRLTYDNTYGAKFREVRLEGEAYFDVVKDKQHPFIVKTNTINLKVLGTAFNVRSYLGEDLTEASLVHGSIQIDLVNSQEKVIVLKPSEKLTINNKVISDKTTNKNLKPQSQPSITLSYIHQAEKDSLPAEALWLESRLAFDSEPFKQVANRLERWYGVKIKIENEELIDRRFTGHFKDESLTEALKALQLSYNFQFEVSGKTVLIN